MASVRRRVGDQGRDKHDDVLSGLLTVDVELADTAIHAVHGGSGPPVLLLHGYPQTHVMWVRGLPALHDRKRPATRDSRNLIRRSVYCASDAANASRRQGWLRSVSHAG
jgi:hypothetical protein